MKDSAWVRLIIMNIKYTKKNLSLILKNIFSKMAKEAELEGGVETPPPSTTRKTQATVPVNLV